MDIINNKLSMLRQTTTTPNKNQQQQQYLRGNPSRICTFCKKREPWNPQPNQKLKRCSRCRTRLYCSRACQRSDWKRGHQRACSAEAKTANNDTSKVKDENGRIETERKSEDENGYFEGLSEEEAMNQLIDAYRLRVEDERIYRGYMRGRYAPGNITTTDTDTDTDTDASLQSALRDFQDFLDLAENYSSSLLSCSSASPPSSSSSPESISSAPSSSSSSESKPQADEHEPETEHDPETKSTSTLLPSWWNPQKRRECEWRALQNQFWSSLCAPVNKGGIVERYRDSMMPMKLRVLAEAVYGYDVMDQAR